MHRAQFAGQDPFLLLSSLTAGFVESREGKKKKEKFMKTGCFIMRIDGYRN